MLQKSLIMTFCSVFFIHRKLQGSKNYVELTHVHNQYNQAHSHHFFLNVSTSNMLTNYNITSRFLLYFS